MEPPLILSQIHLSESTIQALPWRFVLSGLVTFLVITYDPLFLNVGKYFFTHSHISGVHFLKAWETTVKTDKTVWKTGQLHKRLFCSIEAPGQAASKATFKSH